MMRPSWTRTEPMGMPPSDRLFRACSMAACIKESWDIWKTMLDQNLKRVRNRMKLNAVVGAILLAAAPALVTAAVTDSADHGFTVKSTLTIKAAPADVYRRLV